MRGGRPPRGVARWHRWEFAVQAPLDDFLALVQRGLVVRGVHVEEAKRFDFLARGFGTRAYVAMEWTDAGIAVLVKVKSGLFGSPAAMERLLRESAEEAEARLRPGAPTAP
jgi:hypothetical protein